MRADPAVLIYLRNYVEDHGYAPTVREIQEYFGWKSPDTAQRRLQGLADAGYIKRIGPRAIQIKADLRA